MTALPLICVMAFIFCVVVGVLKFCPLPEKNGNWKPPTTPRPDPPKGQGTSREKVIVVCHLGEYRFVQVPECFTCPDPSQSPQSPTADTEGNPANRAEPQSFHYKR